jgi:hypothetical protein
MNNLIEQTNKYRPGQVVYVIVPGSQQAEGPYKIAMPAGPGKYTLCKTDGTQARNGSVLEESSLKTSP